MPYVKNPLQVLAQRLRRSPEEIEGAEPQAAPTASEDLPVAVEPCEFLEVIDEYLQMLLSHVEAVICDLESRYGYIRLQMLVGALHKRARGLGTDGEALASLAGHLDSMCAAAGSLFDLAVEDGDSALELIELALGY